MRNSGCETSAASSSRLGGGRVSENSATPAVVAALGLLGSGGRCGSGRSNPRQCGLVQGRRPLDPGGKRKLTLAPCLLGLGEHAPIGGKARSLDGKQKAVGCLARPFAKALGLLRAVIGGVDLDRREMARRVGELLALRQPLHPPPPGAPARQFIRITLPGFRIPSGSSARLILRMTSTPSGCSASR